MKIHSRYWVIVLISLLFSLTQTYSQCTLGTAVGAFDVSTLVDDVRVSANDTVEGGEYVPLNNIVANKTYVIDACLDTEDTYLTLFNSAFTAIAFSTDGCGNDGEITFVAPANGTYYIQVNVGNCLTNTTDHKIYIERYSCNYPSNPDISTTLTNYCFGDMSTITISGSLNNATQWMIYKDSCGGEVLDSVTVSTYTFSPLNGTRKYFVRGEGGCAGFNGSCDSLELTLTNKDASFFYGAGSYCILDADPSPLGVETSGGTYTSSPAGLSINSTTGVIDNSMSTPGTYTVTYTTTAPCSQNTSVSVEIRGPDNATFSYSATSYCKSAGSSPSATITGVLGGVFSSTAGLSINSVDGTINLTASTAGVYTVTYTTPGICSGSSSKVITVSAIESGAFSFSPSYCVNSTDPSPVITGNTGGVFSSSAGLSINSTTGVIDVSGSTPAIYSVVYTTAGSCPESEVESVTINALDNANYDYGKTTFCANEGDLAPYIPTPGAFSSTPTGLVMNSTSGLIDISASTSNTYSLTYTTTGTCPNTHTKSISINDLDDAGVSYSASAYCQGDSDPTPTISGLAGGVFSSTPLGLILNASTGELDVSASIGVPYNVVYTTSGVCPNTSTIPITINALDQATFYFDKNNYCVSSSDPTPVITGVLGGTFTVSPAGLNIDPSSGLIDISLSTIGNYTVTYTSSLLCTNSTTQNIILSNFDDASFNYGATTYCAFSTDALPTITGLTSGTFTSSPIGLSILPNNGYINTGSSQPGTYTVTYTTAGDCQSSSNKTVTIVSSEDATFNYDAVEYCQGGLDPTPLVAGDMGGTYSSSPVGLAITPTTGVIDLSASTPEVYTVEYTTPGVCSNSSTQAVIVLETSDANFSYDAGSYCVSDADPSPTVTGLLGGVFSSSPIGLVFETSTGVVDLSESVIGNYNITYSVGGDCPSSITQTLIIDDLDNPDFSFSSSNYCTSGVDPTPTISGVVGGIFSSEPVGLSLNGVTGEIDLDLSTIGNYTIKYNTNGVCADSSTRNVSISNLDDASFSYSATNYCTTGSDQVPTITGLSGGTFTAAPIGLDIQIVTGEIDVSGSAPGVYSVTYLTNGDCPNTSVEIVTIDAIDDAGFSYNSGSYCSSETDPTATVTGLVGGVFSSSPSGLVLDANSGLVNLLSSSTLTYDITYTTLGNCPNSSIQTLQVNGADDAAFNYGLSSFCSSDADPIPSVSGPSGGTFVATPPGLAINSSSGVIDIASSSYNSYVITYTTSGSCPNSSSESLDLVAFDDASFSYSATSYCPTNSNPSPAITGVIGGSFTSSPSGLSIDPASGMIFLSNSLLGTYTITYATAGNCQNSSSQLVTITDVDDASFSYGNVNYCEGDMDQLPAITGVTGGTFSSLPVGLSLDANSGNVEIGSSSVGNYDIVYTTPGSCPTANTNVFNLLAIPITNLLVSDCDSSIINGNVYFTSQIVRDTLSGVMCDSIVNTDLTMNYATSSIDPHTVWCSLDWLDGVTYSSTNNTATHILTNSVGCDSVVQLDLTVSSVDITVADGGTSFTANAVNVDYQWLDCNTGFSELIHETYQTFNPTLNGYFAVMITENACTDTSDCLELLDLGLLSNETLSNYEVYPNPFSDELLIACDVNLDFEVQVSNIEGRQVCIEKVKNQSKVSLSLAHLEKGVYFIRIISNGKNEVHKLIKQ